MLYIKLVLFILCVLFVYYFTGYWLAKLLKKEHSYIGDLILGFIFNLAINELLLWPFVAFRLNTKAFILSSILISIIPTILGIYFVIKENRKIKNDNKKEKKDKKVSIKEYIPSVTFFIVILLIELILTSIYYRSDADDSFYVSNSVLFGDSQNLNMYDSSFGDDTLGTVPMYDFQVWESLVMVYSKIFDVDAAIMAHTYLVYLIILLSSLAHIELGKSLFKENKLKNAILFSSFVGVFNLFAGYSTYAFGSRLLSRAWQGKTIYQCVVLPVLISYILENVSKLKPTLFIYVLACSLAGICLNPTSMFVLGFEFGFLLIACAIYKKNFKYILHMIPGVCAIFFFSIFMLIRTSAYSGQIAAASTITYTQIINIIKKFYGGYSIIYLILYILSCITIFKSKNEEQKIYLIIAPILLFVFVLNPIAGKIVAENITKVSTFWRVYWLIPASYGIIVSVLNYINDEKKTKKYIAFTLLLITIILPGKWLVSSNNNFEKVTNIYKLPDDTLEFGEIISSSNNTTTIGTDIINTTLRQRYSNIKLLYSREQYVLDLIYYRGNTNDSTDRINFKKIINNENVNTDKELQYYIDKYNTNWIIVDINNTNVIDLVLDCDFYEYKRTNEHVLLKNTKI